MKPSRRGLLAAIAALPAFLRIAKRSSVAPTYAKVGVTPGWTELEVLDLDTGAVVDLVEEVDYMEGWAVQFVSANGRIVVDGDQLRRQLIRGRFMLRQQT